MTTMPAARPTPRGRGRSLALAWVGPLTGDYANLGIFSRDGAKVAVEQFNETNEDYEIELKEFDTQGAAAQATTQLDRFINDESVIGVVGPTFSGETTAVLPTLQEEGLVMVSPSATNVDLPSAVPPDGVFHRILPDDNAQSNGLVQYMTTKLNLETIGIIHDNSTYGKPLAVEQMTPKLEAAGVEVVGTEAIDPASQDFSSAVNAFEGDPPDAIFFGGYYEAAGRLKKQLSDAGVDSQFIAADGALDVGFVEAAAGTGDGALLSCPCYFASTAAPGEIGEFATAYEELIGNAPGTYSTEGFDADEHPHAGHRRRQRRPRLAPRVRREPQKRPGGHLEGGRLHGQRQHRGSGHLRLQGRERRDRPRHGHRRAVGARAHRTWQGGARGGALLLLGHRSRRSSSTSPTWATSSGPRRSTGSRWGRSTR